MNVMLTFKKIATLTHYQDELHNMIESLPADIKHSYLTGDTQLLRVQIAGSTDFSDAKTVVK